MKRPFKANRGGHAPGHLREAFVEWVEAGVAEEVPVVSNEIERPIQWLLGQLWNCSDIMPSDLCDELNLRAGASYAQGVRHVAKELARPSRAALTAVVPKSSAPASD